MTEGNYEKVVVEPEAFVSMLLHARRHAHAPVHGVLLGNSSSANTLTVTSAVPICHGTPVQPWIETALSLIEASSSSNNNNSTKPSKIVGWYTAPLLCDDTRPGPVALRMASILETAHGCSTLIVLNNQAVGDCCKGNADQVPTAVQAYGKDFGQQYQESVNTVVSNSAQVAKVLVEAVAAELPCNDFVDHLEGEASTPWFPNNELTKLVAKV